MKNTSQKVEKEITFPFSIKTIDETGKFDGYASTFGNKDSQGDVVVKGAFKRSIGLKKGKWVILWQHNSAQPVGVNMTAEEDDKGLKVSGEININSADGEKAYKWMKFAMDKELPVGLSIGFRIVDKAIENGIRYLKEIALVEYSIVTFPANEEASVTGVKSATEEEVEKAMDFNEALQQEMTERELYDMRWTIQSAQCDALCSVQDDVKLDANKKIELIGKIYDQYKTAMVSWWTKWIAYTAETEDTTDSSQSSADTDNEEKVGTAISAATKKTLVNAIGYHGQAMEMHKSANKLHTKGTAMLSNLIGHASQKDSEDTNTPPAVAPLVPPTPALARPDQEDKAAAEAKEWAEAIGKLHATVIKN